MNLSETKMVVCLARQGMNAVQLAQKTGLAYNTVLRTMREMDITPKTAGKIASALGVDVTEIMEDKEN